MKRYPLAAAVVAALLSSCATVVRPGPDRLHVTTEPPGAEIRVDGRLITTSPNFVEIPRDGDGLVTFDLKGHRGVRLQLEKEFNAPFLMNTLWFVPFGLVGVAAGMTVDALNGNAYRYPSSWIHVRLEPVSETASGR